MKAVEDVVEFRYRLWIGVRGLAQPCRTTQNHAVACQFADQFPNENGKLSGAVIDLVKEMAAYPMQSSLKVGTRSWVMEAFHSPISKPQFLQGFVQEHVDIAVALVLANAGEQRIDGVGGTLERLQKDVPAQDQHAGNAKGSVSTLRLRQNSQQAGVSVCSAKRDLGNIRNRLESVICFSAGLRLLF